MLRPGIVRNARVIVIRLWPCMTWVDPSVPTLPRKRNRAATYATSKSSDGFIRSSCGKKWQWAMGVLKMGVRPSPARWSHREQEHPAPPPPPPSNPPYTSISNARGANAATGRTYEERWPMNIKTKGCLLFRPEKIKPRTLVQ